MVSICWYLNYGSLLSRITFLYVAHLVSTFPFSCSLVLSLALCLSVSVCLSIYSFRQENSQLGPFQILQVGWNEYTEAHPSFQPPHLVNYSISQPLVEPLRLCLLLIAQCLSFIWWEIMLCFLIYQQFWWGQMFFFFCQDFLTLLIKCSADELLLSRCINKTFHLYFVKCFWDIYFCWLHKRVAGAF